MPKTFIPLVVTSVNSARLAFFAIFKTCPNFAFNFKKSIGLKFDFLSGAP